MRKDSALALAVLGLLLALQPFLYYGFGPAWSALPIALFALVMAYFVLRPRRAEVEFREDAPEPAAKAKPRR